MILTPADRGSSTWRRILTHLTEMKHSTLLELAKDISPERTAKLRGEIAVLERLINLDTEVDIATDARSAA